MLFILSHASTTGSQLLQRDDMSTVEEIAILRPDPSRDAFHRASQRAGILFSFRPRMYDHVRLFARISAALTADPTLSLEQLAQQLRIHPHTLAHVIQEHTCTSFSGWRAARRLAAACALLQSRPDLSIKEIAAATGFSSTAVFDRFLKRACGRSPSQYRLATTPLLARLAPPDTPPAPASNHSSFHPLVSNVNVLDQQSMEDGVRSDVADGTLDSCTASS
jgi:AraC-like DNA-binding protein